LKNGHLHPLRQSHHAALVGIPALPPFSTLLEPHTGLGRCDLLLNVSGNEYVIEFKIYQSPAKFAKGKEQLAYYSRSMGLKEGIYLVFVPNTVTLPVIQEQEETINGIRIRTYIVLYDEEKDF
jgi:hypothetical protein